MRTGEAYNISNDDDGLTLGEYAEYIASLANLKVRYEIENNESVSKATFGGRLGEYKYYDMDAVIASALDMCEKELQ